MKTILTTIAIALLIGGFIGWSIKPDNECPEPEVKIEYKYITQHDTLLIPKFKTVTKRDTLKFRDTIFVNTQTDYIAEVDTTYKDSSLTAKVQFVSPIPLHPKSYFNLDFNYREKTITKILWKEKEESFWSNRFPVIIGVGLGYDIDNKRIAPNIGIMWGIRIN